jgi:hypothetical protein
MLPLRAVLSRMSVVASLLLAADVAAAQSAAKPPKNDGRAPKPAKVPKDSLKAAKDSGVLAPFFRSEEPIAVTLTTNIKRIRGDKGEDAPWRSATWTFPGPDGQPTVIPVRIKTRGIWRLKTCEFPPLRLNFTSEAVKQTPFKGLDKPKLVNYCRNMDEYERYVLQELQLYRALRVLTPASHAVRLIRLTYADSASGKREATRYAFIEEEPDAMAARIAGKALKMPGAMPDDLDPEEDLVFGLFQYMAGNTDFAISALHNVELVALNSGAFIPIAYDFDFSGAVNARYATVDPKLSVKRVRDRLYRGYCVPEEIYPKVVARFNAKKDSIYALYRDPIGKLLPADVSFETLKHFDEFYKIINDPRALKREIMDVCIKPT